MILERFYLDCLAHASYLVVDERTATAVVIDPQRDVDQYLACAAEHGATIRHVLLTHFHADFVSGHLELQERCGATIHLGAAAHPEYEASALSDGDVLVFGDVQLTILETPGHTPEGISIVLQDLASDSPVPFAVFTGDTLFIGDVGRPDLMSSVGVTAEELATSLYHSLHDKLLGLPDATRVYPAHGAGSLCGKALGNEPFSTIGEQRRFNLALQAPTVEDFVALVTADQPVAPAYFGHDAVLNRRRRPTLDETRSRAQVPLDLEQVLARVEQGALVLDVRDADAFAEGHLRASLNVGLDGRFATWAGSLVDPQRELVVLAEPGREGEAITRLGRIGLDRVSGFLDGGPGALSGRPDLLETSPRCSVDELARRLQGPDAPALIDVRTPGEFAAGHVAGALNLPLGQLPSRLDELPAGRPLALLCQSGYRSSAAASLLAAARPGPRVDVVGGMLAWREAGLPEEGQGAACQADAAGS